MVSDTQKQRPKTVSFIAITNGVAFSLTLLFWILVFLMKLVPAPGELADLSERANAATTYGFGISDLIWSLPLLLLAAIGLWRMRFWGWTAAQIANILWIYSMTVVLIRDAYSTFTPGTFLFTPFALFAFWSIYYLWIHRDLFLIDELNKQKETS